MGTFAFDNMFSMTTEREAFSGFDGKVQRFFVGVSNVDVEDFLHHFSSCKNVQRNKEQLKKKLLKKQSFGH